ncbi:hypothetical protein DMZ48_15910 [Robertkochia solimangrovi]|nr:hypothetical protein DMZ48_15910 [Robertkochia solimangrovi]
MIGADRYVFKIPPLGFFESDYHDLASSSFRELNKGFNYSIRVPNFAAESSNSPYLRMKAVWYGNLSAEQINIQITC